MLNQVEQSYIFNKPKPGTNFEFPGSQYGGTIDQVRSLIRHQKKTKGIDIPLGIGFNTFSLRLSGDARMLLGFILLIATSGDTINLRINSDVILDGASAQGFTGFNNQNLFDDYMIYPRPLSGQDEIILDYTSVNAKFNQIQLVYL